MDGKQLRTRDKVFHGAQLSIDTEPEQAVGWQPQNIDLDIIYEDAHILVVKQTCRIGGTSRGGGTLTALWSTRCWAHSPEMAQLPRGGIVHRLDMETSGIMVAAKSLLAHQDLVSQLQERTVKAGICRGVYWCNDRRVVPLMSPWDAIPSSARRWLC